MVHRSQQGPRFFQAERNQIPIRCWLWVSHAVGRVGLRLAQPVDLMQPAVVVKPPDDPGYGLLVIPGIAEAGQVIDPCLI